MLVLHLSALSEWERKQIKQNIHSNLTQDKARIKHKHLAGAEQKKKEKRRVEGEKKKRNKEKLQASMKQTFGTLQKGCMTFISKW